MKRTGRIVGVVLALVALAAAKPGEPGDPAQLKKITVEAAGPTRTTVQITLSGAAKHRATLFDDPPRLVIDLDDTVYAGSRRPLNVGSDPIKRIVATQPKKNAARVVIELSRKVDRADYEITPTATGLSIGLDVLPGAAAKRIAPTPIPTTPDRPGTAATALATKERAPGEAEPTATADSGDRRVSIDFKDADIVNLLRILAAESGKNVVISDDIKGKVSITLHNVPWRVALDEVLEQKGLRKLETDNVIRIFSKDRFEAKRKEEAESRKEFLDAVRTKVDLEIQRQKATAEEERKKEEAARKKAVEEREFALKKAAEERAGRELEVKKQAQERELEARREAQERELALRKDAQERDLALRKAAEERAARELEFRKEKEERDRADKERELAARRAFEEARGPLTEETIRLSYADPGDVATTLQGILGLGGGAIPRCRPRNTEGAGGGVSVGGAPPLIAEPPFSALYGLQPPRPDRAGPIIAPPDVLGSGLTIRAYCPTNSLFVRMYASELERVKRLIRETLDVPLPQVKIQARVESIQRGALENLGIQWGGGGAGAIDNYQLVGQGVTTTAGSGGAITPPPGIGISTPTSSQGFGNENLRLTGSQNPPLGLLPIDAFTGLPTGGSLINLPLSALPGSIMSAAPTGGFSFGIVGTRFNISLALQALAEQQKSRTIARPEVVTVESNPALIKVGTQIPYATVSSAGTQVQFKDAVLQLLVTPIVIREGDVTKVKMTVQIKNDSRGGDTAAGPIINTQQAETEVLVKSGEHLVIGGVGNSTEIKSVRKVPLFGDIPFFGWMFKQRGATETSNELVVFITPTVLNQSPPGPARASR